MELKLEVQLPGNPLTYSSMRLGCVSFLLWLAFGKGYCLLNPPSVFLSEKNIIISDGENKGKEGKWPTQQLQPLQCLKLQEWHFLEWWRRQTSTSAQALWAGWVQVNCVLWGTGPKGMSPGASWPRTQVCCSADLLCPCCWGKLATAHAAAWRTLLQGAVGAAAPAELLLAGPLAACQAAELFDTVRHRCFRNRGRMWHLLLSFMCTISGQSSFSLILLQLKQFHLGTGLSSHRCLEGKVPYGSVKSQTYFSLGLV